MKVEGDCAVVRENTTRHRVPLEDLKVVRPTQINDCVILLTGSEKGKVFKVKEFRNDARCAVRRVGTRLGKGQTDPIYPMEELTRTYHHR